MLLILYSCSALKLNQHKAEVTVTNGFSAFHRARLEEGNLFKTIVWFNLPDLSEGLNKTAMIILSHLSHRDNHQLCWPDLFLPAEEEIQLGYVTHSQRKYSLEYLDDYICEGHCTMLSWFLFTFNNVLFYVTFFHFNAQLLLLTGNRC